MGHLDFEDFEAEDDIRSLQRAEQIKDDPKRMSKLRSFAKRKADEMEKIANPGISDSDKKSIEQGFTKL